MTTPTPNERDREVAESVFNLGADIDGIEWIAKEIASYRQEIVDQERRKWETVLETASNNYKQRISTLEAALEKAEKAMEAADRAISYVADITTENRLGWARVELDKAITAIREALRPTSPPSTSNLPSEPAAAP